MKIFKSLLIFFNVFIVYRMDENTSKLFVEINPNIDQLAKEQEEVKNEVVSEKELENLQRKKMRYLMNHQRKNRREVERRKK